MSEPKKPVNIWYLRRRLGWPGKALSQAALAKKLGVHQSTVSRMERDPDSQQGPVALLLRTLDKATPEPKNKIGVLFFGPPPGFNS